MGLNSSRNSSNSPRKLPNQPEEQQSSVSDCNKMDEGVDPLTAPSSPPPSVQRPSSLSTNDEERLSTPPPQSPSMMGSPRDDDKLPFKVSLKPHEHSLFCERKQRVCTSVNKVQELEYLRLIPGNPPKRRASIIAPPVDTVTSAPKGCWIRSISKLDFALEYWEDYSQYEEIPNTEQICEYKLTVDDVGRYLTYHVKMPLESYSSRRRQNSTSVFADSDLQRKDSVDLDSIIANMDNSQVEDSEPKRTIVKPDIGYLLRPIGPVVPGPPRLFNIHIDVHTPSLEISSTLLPSTTTSSASTATSINPSHHFVIGSKVIAKYDYIGGYEGPSEFWWFRIRNGERIQLGEPRPLPLSSQGNKEIDPNANEDELSNDPRVYLLTEEDYGCILKVKCRPVRSDGAVGEIFTSKPSPMIE